MVGLVVENLPEPIYKAVADNQQLSSTFKRLGKLDLGNSLQNQEAAELLKKFLVDLNSVLRQEQRRFNGDALDTETPGKPLQFSGISVGTGDNKVSHTMSDQEKKDAIKQCGGCNLHFFDADNTIKRIKEDEARNQHAYNASPETDTAPVTAGPPKSRMTI